MQSKRPSVTYQVERALSQLEAFDESRRAALRDGTARAKIFSFSTRRTYQQCCVRFAKWCQARHGLRWLRDVTPDMAAGYIADLRRNARSPDYVSKTIAAIRKLEVGLVQLGWRAKTAPALLASEQGRHSDPDPVPYSSEEADRLIAALYQCDPQYGQLAQLQRAAGLRADEAAHLQARCIVEDGSRVVLSGSGTHAKGGREREIAVVDKHRAFVVQMRERALEHQDEHVFVDRRTLARACGRAVDRLCKQMGMEGHGTHGFRKTWAAEYYAHLRAQGWSDETARREVVRGLGHNRMRVLSRYLQDSVRATPDGQSIKSPAD